MALGAGKKAPDQVNVLIEIPQGSNVKYEFNEEENVIKVDRILYTAMFYPFNSASSLEPLRRTATPWTS